MLPDSWIHQAFLSLAEQPETAAAVCLAAAHGKFNGETELRAICTKAGLSHSATYQVERTLIAGEQAGIFRRHSELYWDTLEGVDYQVLAHYLKGASLYREHISKPENQVDVVLTKPPSPSKLERALDAMGYKAALLENTGEIFTDLATRSTKRFLVMTPFIDEEGSAKLVQLFGKVPDEATKQLIVRCQAGVPSPALVRLQGELKGHGVQFFNYWLSKEQPGTYETFHAKVVLSDSHRCYVGSANMTQSSFAYSMELGVLVEGKAAKIVAYMCEATISVSTKC